MARIWPQNLLRVATLWSATLLCMLLIHNAFAGRLPEQRLPQAPAHVPAQPAGTLMEAAPDTTFSTLHLPTYQEGHDPQTEALSASTSEAKIAEQAHAKRFWDAFHRYFHWVLWPIIGLVLLGAGLSGRAHLRSLEEAGSTGPHKRRERVKRPDRNWYIYDGKELALGIAAIVILVGLGVFLGSLVLGTLTTGFGLTVIALVLPVALVTALVLLLGPKLLEALGLGRYQYHGGKLQSCLVTVTRFLFLVVVAMPIVLGVTALLIGLMLIILLGLSIFSELLVIAAGIMIVCSALGILSFLGINGRL